MKRTLLSALSSAALLLVTGAAQATTYTSDTTLSHFFVSNYATLSNFSGGDLSSPTTPTNTTLTQGLRVFAGGSLPGLSSSNNWILATFSSPVASIRVFPNIDHFGAQYDGFQYTIFGSNNGTTWTPLFDAITVVGATEPFTLGTFTGTAPFTVNNVLTPGAGPGGTVGYIADFTFGSAFLDYAFGASTVAIDQFNADQEFSAVGALGPSAVPLPAALPLFATGLAGLGLLGWRRKRKSAPLHA
jgi:hypothetical protein